jgi:DNA replication protein DnaC
LNPLLFSPRGSSHHYITICRALQLPLDHWSEVIADPVIADAIRDRLEHAALVIQITGESYRGVLARKLASKKKDA